MRIARLILVASGLAFTGCRLASNAPNPQWLTDFQKTDAVLVRKTKQELTITDSDTISRLQNIYASAKWAPYWHTLPGNLDDRTIDLLDGENKLRHFSYTGVLWETESYTENRTAELSEADRRWIESIFAMVPQREVTPESETPK